MILLSVSDGQITDNSKDYHLLDTIKRYSTNCAEYSEPEMIILHNVYSTHKTNIQSVLRIPLHFLTGISL